jgi:hypothetical protein
MLHTNGVVARDRRKLGFQVFGRRLRIADRRLNLFQSTF